MKIAIIGAGNVGSALAASATRGGHTVTVADRNPEKAREVAQAAGASAAQSNADAVREVDAVILALPFAAVEDTVREAGDALDGIILIDPTNRVDLENPVSTFEGNSNAEQIQEMVPNARVIKAFNTAFASRQSDPQVDGMAADGFVAGDDEDAKAAVMDLVRAIGFRPIDAGPLGMARALEAMALLNMTLQARNNWPWQSAWKLIGPTG
jgi:8-hydroxy-5-deazaflavin:NADPH oxidoreductase